MRSAPVPAARRLDRRALAWAAVLAVVVRLVFGLGYWTHRPLTRDEQEYLSLARSLAAGRGFVYDDALRLGSVTPFGRAPGYPAFVALVGGAREIADAAPTAVKVAQAVAGACGVVLLGIIAGRLAGARAGTAAAFIGACYPPLVWIAAYALSEAVFWPMALAVAWLFDAARRRAGGAAWMAAAGIVAGLAVLTRPAFLFFLPIAGLWLLWRRHTALAAALVLGAVIVIAPWTLRNVVRYHRVLIVASDGGVTFWTGNHPLATGEGDMAANPALKLANEALRADHPGLSEEDMEPVYYREAFTWIASHPVLWATLEGKKLFYSIVPAGPSYTASHSRLYSVTSIVSYAIVVGIALAGLPRLRGRWEEAAGLWCAAAAAVSVCLVFFPQERFRIPAIDPALVVCAGAAFARQPEPR